MAEAYIDSIRAQGRVKAHYCSHCQSIRPKKPELIYLSHDDWIDRPLEDFFFQGTDFIRLDVSHADLLNWSAEGYEFASYFCQRFKEDGEASSKIVDPKAIHLFLEVSRNPRVTSLCGMVHLPSVRNMAGPCRNWNVPSEEERHLCYFLAVSIGCGLYIEEGPRCCLYTIIGNFY